jgi:hypothetical protein
MDDGDLRNSGDAAFAKLSRVALVDETVIWSRSRNRYGKLAGVRPDELPLIHRKPSSKFTSNV